MSSKWITSFVIKILVPLSHLFRLVFISNLPRKRDNMIIFRIFSHTLIAFCTLNEKFLSV